ncbi:hypothetical protein N7539_007478 [Penicillium diatomitis]|uniref:DUF3074 domain-containing protein n=1 Tax=Penicillium diatomitis TaxID=2819901 RepID=A0A9X0BNW2_9EURO|nr:uncharacterized protein N7539_007478 [Penicillium diatomitis]KAJ5477334.1 hypothetical protein N7539_007478 [Penicillium diatomitis]
MAALHEALQCLLPTSWDQVPQSPDALRDYLRDIFKHSRLIAESLPNPPPYDHDVYSELEVLATGTKPRVQFTPSSVRVNETDSEVTSLQKEWGKPMKVGGGSKENPLDLHLWKLSSKDGKGTWFGRRSVHEGLPFSRWKEKFSTEYAHSLRVNQRKIRKGQTPDACIRGIGAEKKVECVEVKDEDGSTLGQVNVYHVSAQFPRPTAPRDFVVLMITSDVGLQVGGTKQPGRSMMMISRPCEHPDVPPRNGYTRGEYESVELIREIPRASNAGAGSALEADSENEHVSRAQASDAQDDDESNPVEWIMVTRSDPGGNIPKWMIDKGTPKSVGGDAAKFIKWALEKDTPQKETASSPSLQDETSRHPNGVSSGTADLSDISDSDDSDSDSDLSSVYTDTQSHHGLIASVTGLLHTGLERFAPQALLDYVPYQRTPSGNLIQVVKVPGDGTETPSAAPAHSASVSKKRLSNSNNGDNMSLPSKHSEADTPTLDEIPPGNLPPAELMELTKAGKLTSHEKDLAKLAVRKREVDAKLETVRSELDKLQLSQPNVPSASSHTANSDTGSEQIGHGQVQNTGPSSAPPDSSATELSHSTASSDSKSTIEDAATSDRPMKSEKPAELHKVTSQLFKEEAKLLKQLRKIEASQLKIASKIESKQRKQAERSKKSKSKSEIESLRQEVKDLKKEISQLRSEREKWIDLVSTLQMENKKLAGGVDERK